MKKRVFGVLCALCITAASFSQGAAAVEPQTQITENRPLNTTMETAIELENMKLYDDVFTAQSNTRYYKITVKKWRILFLM